MKKRLLMPKNKSEITVQFCVRSSLFLGEIIGDISKRDGISFREVMGTATRAHHGANQEGATLENADGQNTTCGDPSVLQLFGEPPERARIGAKREIEMLKVGSVKAALHPSDGGDYSSALFTQALLT